MTARIREQEAEIARLKAINPDLHHWYQRAKRAEAERDQLMREIQTLIAERDALQKKCTMLVEMIELMSGIPNMSDELLAFMLTWWDWIDEGMPE